jgi:hypothetical protein
MSILVISPTKEIKINQSSFQPRKISSFHRGRKILVLGFRLLNTKIIVDRKAKNKLLQPGKRYALIGNCQNQKGKWRPCGVFRLPNNLLLQNVEEYVRANIKFAAHYPESTYYLNQKELNKIGMFQAILENDPEEKEVELTIGETALQLCLNKNIKIEFNITDKKNRGQVVELVDELGYLDCVYLDEFVQEISLEITGQIRKTNSKNVEKFFEANLDKVDWRGISRNPNISINFFSRHADKIQWLYLSANPGISYQFLTQHMDKVNWDGLSANRNIPSSFLIANSNKISWRNLSGNSSIPVEFFQRHLNQIDWRLLSANPNIPLDFFIANIDLVDWRGLSENPNIPLDFFIANMENINWVHLSANAGVPFDFLYQNMDKVSWRGLSANTSVPLDFFLENFDKIDWYEFSANSSIPLKIFFKNLEKINWYKLSFNVFLYNKYAMINTIERSQLFPTFTRWKKLAIKSVHKLSE